ncbi:MAG: ABC transporter ATP-binding protein, partial [Clostridiales Family XIII bacterium]|nr:ABC transporter ATP-binding protein [Clostridiales Family XIII bacterium]
MAKIDEINTHTTPYLIKRFVPYFKKYKGTLVLDLFCATLTTLCDLVLPMIVRYLTDLAMNDIHRLTVQVIVTVGALYLALRAIDMIANYYMADIGHVMGARIETDMRR